MVGFHIRPVRREDLLALFRVQVRPDQSDLVAPTVTTIAEAAYETGSRVWGLWDGEVAVGLMAMVHPHHYPWMTANDDPDGAYLWRLLVGADHQRKGYGRAAITAAVSVTRDWGLPRLVAGVVDKPHSNMGFYETLGFRWTGRIVDGEKMIALTVADYPL